MRAGKRGWVASWLPGPGSFAKCLDLSRDSVGTGCPWVMLLALGTRQTEPHLPLAGALWASGQTLGQMVHSSCSLMASTKAARSLVCVVHGRVCGQ